MKGIHFARAAFCALLLAAAPAGARLTRLGATGGVDHRAALAVDRGDAAIQPRGELRA